MKSTLISKYLLLTLFLKSALCNHTCAQCQLIRSTSNICYDDGHVYPTQCHARCKNPSAAKLFTCSSTDTVNACVQQCKESLQNKRTGYPSVSVPRTPNTVFSTQPTSWRTRTTTTFTQTTPIRYSPKNPMVSNVSGGWAVQGYGSHSKCMLACPTVKLSRDHVCASNNTVYPSECHARCNSASLKIYFTCANFFSPAACERKCASYLKTPVRPTTTTATNYPFPNYTNPSVVTPPPTTRPPTPVITRPCLKEDWVCASDGQIYWGTCDAVFNSTELLIQFNCTKNNIHKKRRCKRLCRRLNGDSCLRGCPPAMRNSKACYENGKVMSNPCLAQCLEVNKLFDCRGGRGGRRGGRRCERRCKNQVFGN